MDRLDSTALGNLLLDNLDAGPLENLLDLDNLADFLDFDDSQWPSSGPNDPTTAPVFPGGVLYHAPANSTPQVVPFIKVEGGTGTSSGSAAMGDISDQTAAAPGPSRRTQRRTEDIEATHSRPKKKRTRNNEQMELNRVAQQKYRERKKAEQTQLQTAVDQLAAQLAAMKALEVQYSEMTITNEALMQQTAGQSDRIQHLEAKTIQQADTINTQQLQLAELGALASSQQEVILDQQSKLLLQEQIISSLRDRLRSSLDTAMQNMPEGKICEHLLAAVRSSLYGAKDVEGLQEVLERLPEDLVQEIAKNIFLACREMWPDLFKNCTSKTPCGSQAMSASQPMVA